MAAGDVVYLTQAQFEAIPRPTVRQIEEWFSAVGSRFVSRINGELFLVEVVDMPPDFPYRVGWNRSHISIVPDDYFDQPMVAPARAEPVSVFVSAPVHVEHVNITFSINFDDCAQRAPTLRQLWRD